jgi:hypothetical protein
VVWGLSGAPSFTELKKAGFTHVGTIAYSEFGESEWSRMATWIRSVQKAGFVTFVNFWANATAAMEMAKSAAATGADMLALDELLGRYELNEQQLGLVIESALNVNPKLSFILNECVTVQITNAYAWTAKYASVRIATDSYNDKTQIDYGAQVASSYGKKSIAWLIFAKGSMDFDCYNHLDQWLAYAKERPVDVFFWLVDKDKTWTAQWEQVAGF